MTDELNRDTAFRDLRRVMHEIVEIKSELANVEASRRSAVAAHDERIVALQLRLEDASDTAAVIAEPLIPPGKKSVDIPDLGRVQFRTYAAHPSLVEPRELLEWAVENERTDLYERVPKLLGEQARLVVKAEYANGHLLPGVEPVEERTTCTVEITGGGAA